jgi:hypothetical protein
MQPAGTHPGLGAKEIYDPGQNLRLDVKSVAWTSRGAEVTVDAMTNAAVYCPEVLLVVRDAMSGRILTARYFDPEGYYFLGFIKSGIVPCRQTAVLILPRAERGQNVVFEFYDPETNLNAMRGAKPLAQSRAYRLGQLEDRAREQRTVPGPVEETVASTVRPFVKWALLGTGAYVAVQNRDAIAGAFNTLLQ